MPKNPTHPFILQDSPVDVLGPIWPMRHKKLLRAKRTHTGRWGHMSSILMMSDTEKVVISLAGTA